MAKRLFTYRQLGDIARSPAVRAKLAQVADGIAADARAIAATEGADVQVRREDGTRPKGRPYARVLADADQEWGTSEVARRRILGRAVAGRRR
jgi:hypothetical protein